MIGRILAVAENGWVELINKNTLYILAATFLFGFAGPIYIQHRWLLSAYTGASLQKSIISLDRFVLFVGFCTSFLLASGSIESEVSKRTLCSVMIRPIHRWEYLAGRALSVIGLYVTFAFAAVLCSYGAATLGCSMPAGFLWGMAQRVCRGTAWILIALSLASVTSSSAAVTCIVILALISGLTPVLSNDLHWMVPLIKRLAHYATMGTWPTDYFNMGPRVSGNQSWLLNALVWLENLLYSVVVFLGASWLFAKRDLKLRE